VELAFVIPLVLLFLFGIIDFGLALNQQNEATNIANIGVREAAVYDPSSGFPKCGGTSESYLADWVKCESLATGGPSLTNVCVYDVSNNPASTVYSSGDAIEVKVSTYFGWLKLLTGQVGNLSSTIGGSATMRLETSGLTTTSPAFLTNPAPNSC
jgi:hypothetical protein